jgi:DNA-directed RNA polymerase specialized sigma24 family protein
LEPIERTIVVARDVFGMSNAEIADALTAPPAVIAARLGFATTRSNPCQ